MTKMTDEIKSKIKNLMKSKHMNIYQLSLKSGVSEACIRNWYSKRNYAPNIESLEKVANALEVPFSQLFTNKDENLFPVDEQTKEHLEQYHALNNNKRKIINDIIKEFLKN